jgi:hypothetical protein
MRALPKVVVLSSMLLAGAALAGSGTTKTPTPAPTPAPAVPEAGAGAGSAAAQPPIDPNSVKPEDMPTAVRMRRIEQRTQALKERAWQLKARVQTLKEQMIGGGVGAQALISHENEMGGSFHLVKLTYTLDGTQIFARTDDNGENLYKTKSFDVFTGPISPGQHQLAMIATYRGHGYGLFEYLSKFTFTARNTSSFISAEGKISRVECRGFEKGQSTPMEKRAAIDCKVTDVQPDKPGDAAPSTTPGNTPLPAASASPAPAPAPAPTGK